LAPLGGYLAGFATLIEFVFAPPAIALAIGAYLNVQFPAIDPKWFAVGAYSSSWPEHRRRAGRGHLRALVTLLAIFELLVFMGVVSPGFSMANFVAKGGWSGRTASARPFPACSRDPVCDLVLPGDRRRGHGGRRSQGP
jgi:ethanolamine permease